MKFLDSFSRACVLLWMMLMLPVATSASAADANEVVVPIAFEKLTGMSAESGWLRLDASYVQAGNEAIWMEAEEPTALVLQEKAFENPEQAFTGIEERAGEGRYIAFVERAQYALTIKTPGSYQVWYRAWFPWKGGWNHKERILGRIDENFVVDCNANADEQLNHWMWVKGPVYKFDKPGQHVWELCYQAGARLDRMVFTPDLQWQPKEGEVGPRATVTAPNTGTALTAPVRPKKVKGWGTLRFVSDPREGKIVIESSTDGGKTWAALPEGGNLAGIAAKGDGTDELRFRITTTPSAAGRSPVIQSLMLSYQSGRERPVIDYVKLPEEFVCKDKAIPMAGARPAGGRQFFAPDAEGRFWLDVEQAEGFLYVYPPGDPSQRVEGAAGRCLYGIIGRPMILRHWLTVPADTTYDLYFRVRGRLRPDGWYALTLDGEAPVGGRVSEKIENGTWQWVKGSAALTIAKGLHSLYYVGGFTDCWLDRIALVPKGGPAPQEQGGLGARTDVTETASPGGVFDGSALLALAVTRDSAVLFGRDGGVCGVRGIDGWRMPPGTRAPGFAIAYQLPGVYRLSSLTSDNATLADVRAIGDEAHSGLVWTYELLDGALTVVTSAKVLKERAKAGPGERGVMMDISVENNSPIEIRHVDFPVLARVGHGNADPAANALVFPQAYSSAVQNPFSQRSFSYQPIVWPGTASMSWMDLSSSAGGLYLAAYHKDMLGVEFDVGGAEDRRSIHMGFKKQVHIGPGEKWSGTYCLWPHEGDWHVAADAYREWADSWMPKPDFPDWLRKADGLYSPIAANGRFYSRFATHVTPLIRYLGYDYSQQWGMTCDAEFCGLHPALNPRYGTVQEARTSHEASRKLGIHRTYYINCQGWYPGFSTLDKIGWVPKSLFPEGVRIEPADFFDKSGLRTWGGKLITYGAGVGYTSDDRIMCASSQGWQDHFMYWLGESLPRDYGTDGNYIDQTGCTFQYCYGENHGHGKQHATWGKGYAELLARAHAEAKKYNPDQTFGVEGITDVLAPVAWGLWVHRTEHRGEVFLYTRPGAILYRGMSNGHNGAFPSLEDCAADCFLYNRWDFATLDPWFLRMLRLRQRVKDWMYDGRFMDDVGLTVEGGPVDAKWFLVKDEKREGAVITVHNWTGVEGATVSLLRPDLFEKDVFTLVYTDDGKTECRAATVSVGPAPHGRMVFPIPPNRCSAILVMKKFEPPQSLRVHADYPLDEGANRIELTLVNLAGARKATVAQKTGVGGKPLVGAVNVKLPAWGVTVVNVPVGDRNALDGMVEIPLVVTCGDIKKELRVPLFGVLTNGDFEQDGNGDGVPDGWGTWNQMVEHMLNRYVPGVNLLSEIDGHSCARLPFSGKTCLEVPKSFDYIGQLLGPPWGPAPMRWTSDSQQYVFLRPNHRYRLSVAMRAERADGKVEASILRATLRPARPSEIVGEWKTYSAEFATDANTSGPALLTLTNGSNGPAWFDAVKLEELGPAPQK